MRIFLLPPPCKRRRVRLRAGLCMRTHTGLKCALLLAMLDSAAAAAAGLPVAENVDTALARWSPRVGETSMRSIHALVDTLDEVHASRAHASPRHPCCCSDSCTILQNYRTESLRKIPRWIPQVKKGLCE